MWSQSLKKKSAGNFVAKSQPVPSAGDLAHSAQKAVRQKVQQKGSRDLCQGVESVRHGMHDLCQGGDSVRYGICARPRLA